MKLIGQLTLADTALGHVAAEILDLFEGDPWVSQSWVKRGATTGFLLNVLDKRRTEHQDVFPDCTEDWVIAAKQASKERNHIVHARAAFPCQECGAPSWFVNAKTSEPVDLSKARVRVLRDQIDALTAEGRELEFDVVKELEAKAVAAAQVEADRTGQVQGADWPQPRWLFRFCDECAGGEGYLLQVGKQVHKIHPRASSPPRPCQQQRRPPSVE